MNTDKNKVFNKALLTRLIALNTDVTIQGVRHTPAYVGTVFSTESIAEVRLLVRQANKKIKKAGAGVGFKIDVKGRLGPNSPHREHYRHEWKDNNGKTRVTWRNKTRVTLDHAARFDVYLYYKSWDEECHMIGKAHLIR